MGSTTITVTILWLGGGGRRAAATKVDVVAQRGQPAELDTEQLGRRIALLALQEAGFAVRRKPVVTDHAVWRSRKGEDG